MPSSTGSHVVAGDQGGDVVGDHVGEAPATANSQGPVPYAFADMHACEVGQVADVDGIGELAVLLGLGEQVREYPCIDLVLLGTGQYPVLVPVALKDRLDDQLAGVASH